MKKKIKKISERLNDALNIVSEFDDNFTWESSDILSPKFTGEKNVTYVEHVIDDKNIVILGITKDEFFMHGFCGDTDEILLNEQKCYLFRVLSSLGYKFSPEKCQEKSQTICDLMDKLHFNNGINNSDETQVEELSNQLMSRINDFIKEMTDSEIASLENFNAFANQKGIDLLDCAELEKALMEYISFFKS